MNDPLPTAGTGFRPFCVPINETFASACAEILGVFRELADEALTVSDGKLNQSAVFIQEAGSLAALPDGQEKEARKVLHGLLLDAGHLIWVHAVDHVRSLEHDILMQPPPVWSPLTLARVTLEGCAFTGYLYDPSIPLAQRLARAAGLRTMEARNEAIAAAGFGPEEQAGAQAARDGAERLALDAGATERLDRRNRIIGYTIDGEYAPMDHKIAAQARAFLPSWAEGSYPLLSGAAHGRPWMIARGRSDGEWAGEAATIMAAVMTVLGSLESGVSAWAGYFGLDASGTLAVMGDRRMDFLKRSIVLAHS